MRTSKLLTIPALLLALILALCGCEIDLTNLVTDVILITSKEASSEPTAEVSSVEEAPSSEPAEESSSETTTSDTTAEPSELPEPEPEPEPEPVPVPYESDPVSSKFTPPSSKPVSSKAPVSSETASQPVIIPQPAPKPMYEEILRTDFWGLLHLLADQEVEEITAIGALMPFMLAKGSYRGTYTDSKRMGAILQLAEELTYDEFIGVWMDTVDWRELEPVQLCAEIGGKLYYCRTVYAERVEGVCYLYEYIRGEQYVRYTIAYATQTDVSSEISSAAAE